MDKEFTKKIQDWLDEPSHETVEDIMAGAMLLLQCNRNRILYDNVSRRPLRLVGTVEYELKKHLAIRRNNQTLADVQNEAKELYKEIEPAMKEEPEGNDDKSDNEKDLPAHGGKRADHEQLPDNIKAIWQENAVRWKHIKELYETCKTIKKPCDLAEDLHQMKQLWYKYKSEFERYDSYVITEDASEGTGNASGDGEDAAAKAKEIANARAYISKQLKEDKLLNMKKAALADGADEKAIETYNKNLKNTQDRVQVLIDNDVEIGDESKAKLTEAGIVFPTSGTTEEIVDDKEGDE